MARRVDCGHPESELYRKPSGHIHHCRACRREARSWLTDEHKARKAARRRRLKAAAVEAYGGECVCCGETAVAFLTIDHVDGGGAVHRRELSGGEIYPWLARNGYPKDGFQLLCWNCNAAKHFEGTCPHQKER